MSATEVPAPLRREKPDPVEASGRIPRWYFPFALAMLIFGGTYLYTQVPEDSAGFAGDSRTVQAGPAEVTGESLFSAQCVACHQESGMGVPGVFPPLGGSEWVTRDPETPVRILLRGIQGRIEVQGETYEGNMPSFAHLSDEDIAKLVSHVRTAWGNDADEIDPELVSRMRAELEGQADPWAGGDELSTFREP